MDVVVTVPKSFTYPAAPGKRGLAAWVAEGDAAGEEWSGALWEFSTWGFKPRISEGERVYVVCNGRLRGYAPLVRLHFEVRTATRNPMGRVGLVRGGGAMAVTIATPITGFRGWRYRWWKRDDETAFPDWRSP